MSIYRSGIEEVYSEKEQLLQEIYELKREFTSSNALSRKIGTEARTIALQNIDISNICNVNLHNSSTSSLSSETIDECFQNQSSSSTSPPLQPQELVRSITPCLSQVLTPIGPIRNRCNRPKQSAAALYLQERHRNEIQMQKDRLEFEKQKLKLETDKFNLDKEGRMAKIKLEIKERTNNLESMSKQSEMMEIMLKLVSDYKK